MKIGDRIFVRGYIDEIRKDTVIVRNDGGYFGTVLSEVTGELPSAQPESCEDAVSRKAVEEMLQNGFPVRGMWEIEGDVVKQTVCETLADALMDLEKLPSVMPKPEQRWIPCGKCIHADGKHRWCKILDRSINEDYFCCWAEPFREEGDK